MTLPPAWRRLVLATHVASSVGALGAVIVFLAFAIIGFAGDDDALVRAAYVANGVIAQYIVMPLVAAGLIVGIVQGLVTPWGLFRHYWVIAKLFLTIVTLYVLWHQMAGVRHAAAAAAAGTLAAGDLSGLRTSFLIHASGGIVALALLIGLSIYKPRGVTRHGWRRMHEDRARES